MSNGQCSDCLHTLRCHHLFGLLQTSFPTNTLPQSSTRHPMASKAAHKRVSATLANGTMISLTPISAYERVCHDAKGATALRLGCARREEHLDLCVPISVLAKHIVLITLQGTSLLCETSGVLFYSSHSYLVILARPSRFSIYGRRVPWPSVVPFRVPLQTPRHQGMHAYHI
jgi:hypothetical protein